MEEFRQEQEEISRQLKEKRDARARAGVASMSQFDRPVSPANQKPFYSDDAPTLSWPRWLVCIGTTDGCETPTSTTEHGQPALRAKYHTSTPMSKLHQYYLDLFKSNGFTLVSASLSTGQTSTGVKQNATGNAEFIRKLDGQPTGPSIHVRVSYSRFYLNEPITVSIGFTSYGSFGSHGM